MTDIQWLQDLWSSGKPLTGPLTDVARVSVLAAIIERRDAYSMHGKLSDLFKLQEMWCLRIGPDDPWLIDMYNENYPTGAKLKGPSE